MKKLRIGVIGAGRIGKVHAATIAQNIPEAELIAIADVNIAEAEKLAAQFQIKQCTKDYKEILSNPEIDAVVVCSPTNTHAQYIVEAAKSGKHTCNYFFFSGRKHRSDTST